MSVLLQQPVTPVDADVAAARRPRPRAALAVAMSGFAIALLIVPVGVGGSFTVPPIASLLPGAVAARQAGFAGGVLDTFRQMGGSFGVAVCGAIVAAQASLLHGLRISLTATAIVLAVTAAVTLTVRRAAAQWHHPQERCTPQPSGRTTRCRQSR